FWKPKLEANRERDRENQRRLVDIEWKYLVVWKCEVKETYLARWASRGFRKGSIYSRLSVSTLRRYSPEVVNYGILLRTTRVRSSRCGAALRKSKTSRITDSRIALALCRACRSRLCLNRSWPNCSPSGFQDSVIPSV